MKACDFLVSHVSEALSAARPAIERISAEVWDLAEMSLHEVESSQVSIGVRGALAAAEVLTLTALDVVTHAELRAAARADFEQRTAGHEYVSPLRPEQLRPEGLPVLPTSDGSGEALGDLARSKA